MSEASTSDVPKRVFVIGGSGVLGRGVCAALARDGARVALTFHSDESGAQEVASTCDAAWVGRLDARDVPSIRAAVDAAADALSGLDALVYAAGVATAEGVARTPQATPTLAEIEPALWERTLAVNATGAFFAAQAAEPHLVAAGGGNVVFIGSVDGSKALPGPMHYAISKGTLDAMARALGKHLGPVGVRVLCVSPGLLQAGLSETLAPDLVAEYEKHCGLKRRGEVREAAEVVSWFALRNTYLTGRSVLLDGAL